MACTIDHLRVDHRITVLRDFTDLAGVTIRAGESAVLFDLGLDTKSMEIWLGLERNGVRQQHRFALRATDGPRNGRMRDYFEMGDPVDDPPAPVRAAKPPPPPPPRPRRSLFELLGFASKQAPADTSLGERRVACDCDTAFHRDLYGTRGELTVAACLRCGTLTCSRSFGDDGRFTGDAWQEVRTVTLPDRVHRWLAGWPRVKIDYAAHNRWPMSADLVRYPTLFYPADTRCADLARLAEAEAHLAREQAGRSRAQCVRWTHRVSASPPEGLPEPLRGYAMLWEALQLGPDSALSDLLHHAQLRSPGSDIAAEVIRERADAFELIVDGLRSADPSRQGVGFAIARDGSLPDPRLASVLIELLGTLSFEPLPDVPQAIASRGRCALLLLLIADLQMRTPEMLATLRALMRKLARHDAFLVDCVRIVLRELESPPAGDARMPAK